MAHFFFLKQQNIGSVYISFKTIPPDKIGCPWKQLKHILFNPELIEWDVFMEKGGTQSFLTKRMNFCSGGCWTSQLIFLLLNNKLY